MQRTVASELAKKNSSQVAIPESVSGVHGELQHIQRKLTKLGSEPKPTFADVHPDSPSQNQEMFRYHYLGSEEDLVKLNKFERVVDNLTPGVTASVLSALWFSLGFPVMMIAPEVTVLGLLGVFVSLMLLIATPVLLISGIFTLREEGRPEYFYLLSLKNKTINRKRYRRELQKFAAEEDKKRQLHEATVVKYHKKRDKLKAALEPLSAQYGEVNPGRRLTVSSSHKIVEGVDVDLPTIDRIALNSMPRADSPLDPR